MTLLAARTRCGRSVIEAVLTDFDRHGPQAVQSLREADPAGYGKVLTDLLAVRDLLRAEAGERTKRASRRAARSRRTRAAHRLLAVLEADFQQHGARVIERLRTEKPQAWARLVSEVVQFRLLPKTLGKPPQRQPRPLRMKLLAEEMRGPQKINLDDSHLPPDQREELLRIMDEVGTNRLDAMGLEELLEYFPDALALWFWRWLGAGRDGRGTCGAKGTRSESHAEPRTSPLVDAFRV